ncbi:MAG: radical SAM protein [Thermoprotei archaeon]
MLLSAGTYRFLRTGRKFSETAYALMAGGCKASCSFCSQPLSFAADKSYLSRVRWFPVELESVAERLTGFRRFCLQTVVKDGFEEETVRIVRAVRGVPKSVTIVPVSVETLLELKEEGVDYLGSGVDTVPRLFRAVNKPFDFWEYFQFLVKAREVLGPWRAVAHLIYGLGETDREFAETMELFLRNGVSVALFAFTPVKGTPLEGRPRPNLRKYRMMQALRLALMRGRRLHEVAEFDGEELVAVREFPQGHYFTSGCPHCDRPYYNEDPLGPQYNLPYTVRDLRPA